MSERERLRAMCEGSDEASVVRDLREVAAPLLAAVGGEAAQALVGELLLGLAEHELGLCAQVFEASRHTEPLFGFSSCALGAAWLPVAPATFVAWGAPPPDAVRGRVGAEVAVVEFEPQGPGARAQAEAAVAAGGEALEVVVVLVKGLEEQKQALGGLMSGEQPASEGGAAPIPKSVCVVSVSPAQAKGHKANAVARISRQRILHDPVAMVDLALRWEFAVIVLGCTSRFTKLGGICACAEQVYWVL